MQLLSRLTQYAGLAVPPGAAEEPIVRLELIDMGPTVMILAVGQHGRVDKQVIDRPEGLDLEDVRAAERRLQGARRPHLPRRPGGAPPPGRGDRLAGTRPLVYVADALRTATQGEGAAHVVVGGVSNLDELRRGAGRPSDGCSRPSSASRRC